MKIIGIIAEYNPFHNGHKYQIEELKKRTNADYVVIAMSGNFVQRGVPALCDKYSRAKMALMCGADLVFELPAIWATASAELFAKGGVTLFYQTGVVNHLGFGAETDNLDLLKQIAWILSMEPVAYKNALSVYLKKGKNFPTARKLALSELFSDNFNVTNATNYVLHHNAPAIQAETHHLSAVYSSELDELLNSPNNILAIEYLKAIYAQNKRNTTSFSLANENDTISSHTLQQLTPVLIQRKGSGYHEKNMNALHPSATAIRNLLFSSETSCYNLPNDISKKNYDNHNSILQKNNNLILFQNSNEENHNILSPTFSLKERLETSAMPKEALAILSKLLEDHALLNENDISSILGYRLLSLKKEGYASFADCSADFSNKIVKNLRNYTNFIDFCELLKSKELTHTRISRTLLHILLDIKQSDYIHATEIGAIPYLRILGFRKDSTPLLSAIKKEATVPLITKVADAASILSSDAYTIFEKDLFVSDVYYQLLSQKTGKKPINEFTHPIVIV